MPDVAEMGRELPQFGNWAPTQFDVRGIGSDGREDWRVLPVMAKLQSSRSPEPRAITTACKHLDARGAEYEVHRRGHWGLGWFEIVVVKPDEVGLRAAGEIVRRRQRRVEG